MRFFYMALLVVALLVGVASPSEATGSFALTAKVLETAVDGLYIKVLLDDYYLWVVCDAPVITTCRRLVPGQVLKLSGEVHVGPFNWAALHAVELVEVKAEGLASRASCP